MPSQVNVRRPSGASRYQAPSMRLGRSQFDLTHSHKTTFDASQLVPYFVKEVTPGETLTCKLLAFARIFSPLDAPIMDDIELSIDFFYVPNRIIWDNWENFLGAHDSAGAQDVDFTIPILDDGQTIESMDLGNYMGLPVGLSSTATEISALPFRAYVRIYNEWYRDQNLRDKLANPTDDGPDDSAEARADLIPLLSAKKHDYFTSALPYLQKGDAEFVPLAGNALVESATTNLLNPIQVRTPNVGDALRSMEPDGSSLIKFDSVTTVAAADQLYANLGTVTAGFSINALREAAAIQRLLEKDARGGTRHPELIRAQFGVDVPDFRTQRPEYLGGGRGFINISPIANTSGTATEDQGQLSGTGAGTLSASFAKSFVEHGYVLGLLRARGTLSYHQGVDRFWTRSTKYDFLWPELAQLGEQPIYNRELWLEGDATDDDIFGYQERYAEYRFKKSLITGKFASDAPGSLDYWHLAEDFAAQPVLNSTFITDATPMVRVTTVDTEPDFIIDGRFDLRSALPLPVRPTPSLLPARF